MPEKEVDPISQYRLLGGTGERVSAIGLGGYHLGQPPVTEQLSLRIVRGAIGGGILVAAAIALARLR
jgi:aryl-alcohol dehydrogenase-like predicted oxidoreductase